MSTATLIDRVIGSRLRAERIARQIDAEAFSRSIGVTAERLAAFESGLSRIDAHSMLAICRHLDVSVRHFFEKPIDQTALPLAAE